MSITNRKMQDYQFLQGMYADGYFPNICVDKVKQILVTLCERIECEQPADLGALYRLTHAATEQINDLESFFDEHESELETVAREVMAEDFAVIADAYGFDTDTEELIAPREW